MKGWLLLIICFFSGLGSSAQGFKKVPSSSSGIDFTNSIYEDDTLNGLSYLYLYNGGGVAVGDVNNDGLEDLYFTGNQVEDRLYLNKGNLEFKDVTKKFFKGQRFDFHTGATMVDINNDGWLDIYVCAAGPAYNGEDRRNKLFINQEGKGFVNEAEAYGLDDSLNTTQAVFFDADNDGDLDAYLLNHNYFRKNTQYLFQFNRMKKIYGQDRLMINENGVFKDNSLVKGIKSIENGQGVVVSDFNQDGWQDIYVSNDFEYGDKLFINTGKGFKEQSLGKIMHTPLFSMGVDAADFNNDGLTDIITVDMANEDHVMSKKNMGGMDPKGFWNLVKYGQNYQYMFNALQLNLGDKFIDVAQLAGVSKTDWSWAPLIADFDNDGLQDLYVSNGYYRDLRDNDFIAKYDRGIQISEEFMPFDELVKLIPSSKTPNHIFKNTGDTQFERVNASWGLAEAITVNGAAYADLDNDGDLDLICNASNEPSFILENTINQKHNYLKVSLTGAEKNKMAIGARVEVYCGEDLQVREVQPSRGFQSGMSSTLHFGMGGCERADSVLVRINGVVVERKKKVELNQTLKFSVVESHVWQAKMYRKHEQILERIGRDDMTLKHFELEYDDFEKEILLPHKMSRLGPFITVGDINGDGLDDLNYGAARGSKGGLLVQTAKGYFRLKPLEIFKTNYLSEEMESIFFDADNDGDQDVYVVMGSNESDAGDASYQDQLYLNDGEENFTASVGLLPENLTSGQKVIARDLNADGWMDLLVFGRQTPAAYPMPPDSYILMNDSGKFVDKTREMAPCFEQLGMVTDAVFCNVDDDESFELIVVGEWMPVTILDYVGGQFRNVTEEKGLAKTVGWWNTVELYKDENGKQEFILGNLGLNNKFHPTATAPLHIYMNDFDNNGSKDIVLAKEQEAILYPVRGLQCSSQQMPFIKQKFDSYDLFANADVEGIYTAEKLKAALHYEAHTFASSVLTIQNGEFNVEALPNVYQTGPINAVVVGDFDSDGKKDIFCFGNKFEAEVETVRYDGNPSLYANGRDLSNATRLGIIENVKSAQLIKIAGVPHILLGVNNDLMQIYKINL